MSLNQPPIGIKSFSRRVALIILHLAFLSNFPQSLLSRPFYCRRLLGMRVSARFMYPLLSFNLGEEIQ
jgi:hypothetical protein